MTTEISTKLAILAFASAMIDRIGRDSPAREVVSNRYLLADIADMLYPEPTEVILYPSTPSLSQQVMRVNIKSGELCPSLMSRTAALPARQQWHICERAVLFEGMIFPATRKPNSQVEFGAYSIDTECFIPMPSPPDRMLKAKHPHYFNCDGEIEMVAPCGSHDSIIQCRFDPVRRTWGEVSRHVAARSSSESGRSGHVTFDTATLISPNYVFTHDFSDVLSFLSRDQNGDLKLLWELSPPEYTRKSPISNYRDVIVDSNVWIVCIQGIGSEWAGIITFNQISITERKDYGCVLSYPVGTTRTLQLTIYAHMHYILVIVSQWDTPPATLVLFDTVSKTCCELAIDKKRTVSDYCGAVWN